MHVDYEDRILGTDIIPERKLLAAVLYRAFNDLFSKETSIFRSAVNWFLHNDKDFIVIPGFTFSRVADELDFSDKCIRMIHEEVKKAVEHRKCIQEPSNGESMSEGKESGEGCSELAERAGLPIGKKKRAALRLAHRWRHWSA